MTENTANMEITFEKQFNGYDRSQVDRYVAELSGAYQKAYGEYLSVCDKYNGLIERYRELEARERGRPSADIISKTLVDTEILAGKIIEDARAEAAKIQAEARENAKRIAEDAYITVAAEKLKAEKIMAEAAAETVRAKKASEHAGATVSQIIGAMQELLTAAAPEAPPETSKYDLFPYGRVGA
ncbi:MAG: DivIVA domain-containing protein [Oscillospiraceae bacterium]|nr:DivIVA domain-containing protein [Oscillospiraceae bacterium]